VPDTTSPSRTLVGGIGYRNLRDHSIGPMVADRLEARAWPGHVAVEDLSYNPIALVHRLQEEPPDRRFTRVVVVGAADRSGRAAGAVNVYRWDGSLPSDEAVQRAVTEAVTGVIALDNTLVVARYFGGLPDEVLVVDVQPEVHEFGDTLGPALAPKINELCALVTRLALERGFSLRTPLAPLGGGFLAATPAS
jgi:hydrogenase maturation protease